MTFYSKLMHFYSINAFANVVCKMASISSQQNVLNISTRSYEFPTKKPVTRSFDVFFDLHLNKRLSKQLWRWWFETPSRSLWRHCSVIRTSESSHTFSRITTILYARKHTISCTRTWLIWISVWFTWQTKPTALFQINIHLSVRFKLYSLLFT